MYILGISCYYHDSSATLLKDGEIVAAMDEERFTRKKHDSSFPFCAINECLKIADISVDEISYVCFYEKPLLKFERILFQYIAFFPKNFRIFLSSMSDWLTKKLKIQKTIRKKLGFKGEIFFINHHLSHASSSFYTSSFNKSAVVVIDGVGEWATTSIGVCDNSGITILKEIHFPHSVGLLYSSVTAYLGFRVNNSEYKVMGLSAYGDFNKKTNKYYHKLKKTVSFKEDGSFCLNLDYFDFYKKNKMPSKKMCELLGGKIRLQNEKLTERDEDIAAALQMITEELVMNILKEAHRITDCDNLLMSGGVALNSVLNGKILSQTKFKNLWIQPASSDSGTSMGAALYVHNSILKLKRSKKFNNAYLGSSYSDEQIEKTLKKQGVNYKKFLNQSELIGHVAELLFQNKVIAWFQGEMEWGPRALGNRSILANPADENARDNLNSKVKFRELFRPFAPVVCFEDVKKFFDYEGEISDLSEYMLEVCLVKKEWREKIPSIVHVNGTGRLQAIRRSKNKMYYDLIKEFGKISGIPMLINTSFNVRGEPITRTPKEAIDCFFKTGIDSLVLNNFLVSKNEIF